MKSFVAQMSLVLFILTPLHPAFAGTQVYEQEEEKVPVKEGYEPLDMSEYQKFEKTKPKSGKKKISTSCRDITGTELKPNDPGYETCLRQVTPDQNNKKSPSNNLNFQFESED